MSREIRSGDDASRRSFLESVAKAALGVSILPLGGRFAHASALPFAAPAGKAKHVIYLFMQGAMSHIDTFDPKPDSETGGETKAIQTAVSGIRIGNHLPLIAKQMNDIALVRSMTTETGAHEQGQYLMRTSYKPISSIRHPFLGSWLHKFGGKLNPELPGSVLVGNANRHPANGYLSAEYAPTPVASAAAGLENTTIPSYITNYKGGDLFQRRLNLTSQFEAGFNKRYPNTQVRSYLDFYREATSLLKSQDLAAFKIAEEPEDVRKAYGENRIGQGLLLARRLIEKKVRFVEVEFGSWDHHQDVYTRLPDMAGQLDQAISTLLDDLRTRGMLSDTLIVLGSEFGRTPNINQNAGRDHHPGCFTALLAGAGIRGGQVYGATDAEGRSVEDGHCYPADFNATIAKACGLPIEQEVLSDTGRPFKIAHEGTPVDELLS